MMMIAGGQCSSAKKNASVSTKQTWFIASADGDNSFFNMEYTVMLTSLTVAVSKSALGALLQGDRLCVTLPKKGQCGSTNPTW
jgi:hypothetical protein